MTFNPGLVIKLDALDGDLQDLRSIQSTTFAQFEADKMLRRYSERMLQMTAEQCVHIGIGILMDSGLRAPENYHDVFIVLGEHHILTPILVNSMTMMVELRNLLVYEYDVLDHRMVYSVLHRHLDDVAEFSSAARAYAIGETYHPSSAFQTEASD